MTKKVKILYRVHVINDGEETVEENGEEIVGAFYERKKNWKKKSRGKVVNYILNGNAMKAHLIVG